ncbi:MAG TPA: hypothetical protein VH881_12855 [Burkholderiales bacterium]
MKSVSLPFMVRQAHHERPFPSSVETPVRPEPVEGGRARFLAAVLAWASAAAIAGCALGYTSVREIKARPDDYMGKEVRLQGAARQADPPGPANAYWLRDGTGEIAVVTRHQLPAPESEVALRGVVRGVVSRGPGWSLELRVEETERLR